MIKQMAIIWMLIFGSINPIQAQDNPKSKHSENSSTTDFDKIKWRIKQGYNFPYRDQMLETIVNTDLVRKLKKDEILELLGETSYYRENKNYLYYLISQYKLLGVWTLHTKTLVIKLTKDSEVEWIKIHE